MAGTGGNVCRLLDDYGIDIIVMSCFDPISGAACYLPAALADPEQTEWTLVYRDARALIYTRRPAADVQPLNSGESLDGMEENCLGLMREGAPACARGMIDVFTRIGDQARARKWTQISDRAQAQ